jgi:uracil-DNA glycosylase family 4
LLNKTVKRSGIEFEHYCSNTASFPISKFFQNGKGPGAKILIVGESPAPNGWRKSGRAFYTTEGKLLPSGRNLNKLLRKHYLSVEQCAFTEIVKCYIGKNRSLLYSCGEKCWPIFERQLASQDFKLLITLGVTTLAIINKRLTTNIQIGIVTPVQINDKHYFLLPIYHPSPMNAANQNKNLTIFDHLLNDTCWQAVMAS